MDAVHCIDPKVVDIEIIKRHFRYKRLITSNTLGFYDVDVERETDLFIFPSTFIRKLYFHKSPKSTIRYVTIHDREINMYLYRKVILLSLRNRFKPIPLEER